ncbi:MAG: polysaccharide deacetylase family protein, partial [Gammaproteobacteria bacterium]
MWLVLAGFALVALAHTAPAPFPLEYAGPNRSMWQGPPGDDRPAVYLTFDDGPNPGATPALLDVLHREGVKATFFVIPAHLNEETAPTLRRTMAEGHAVGLHSHTRALMLKPPRELASLLDGQAAAIESMTGRTPLRPIRRGSSRPPVSRCNGSTGPDAGPADSGQTTIGKSPRLLAIA